MNNIPEKLFEVKCEVIVKYEDCALVLTKVSEKYLKWKRSGEITAVPDLKRGLLYHSLSTSQL